MTETRLTTRAERETLRSIKRVCRSGLDSVTLRREVAELAAAVVPVEGCAMVAVDPDTSLFTHGWVNGLPDSLVRTYMSDFYPEEAAEFADMARSGRVAAVGSSPSYLSALRADGMEHQMHVVLCTGREMWGSWCLFRDGRSHGFSDRDLRFFELVGPHVGLGMRSAALLGEAMAARSMADAPAAGVVVLDARRRITLRSGSAASQMADLATVGVDVQLPYSILSLLWQLEAGARRDTEGCSAALRAQGRSGQWYVLRASLAEPDAAGECARVIVIQPAGGRTGAGTAVLSNRYSLTAREVEVLQLVLLGEATKSMAVRLGLSPHTVKDHVDHVCEKIGVRGRKALLAKIIVEGGLQQPS